MFDFIIIFTPLCQQLTVVSAKRGIRKHRPYGFVNVVVYPSLIEDVSIKIRNGNYNSILVKPSRFRRKFAFCRVNARKPRSVHRTFFDIGSVILAICNLLQQDN